MLDAYLDRIGWRGDRAPTRATLEGLVRAHMEAIPFENFDVLLGRGIRLDLDSLVAKLVTARRGGYCYEHATLVAHVLRQLGFVVHCHSARVTMMGTRETSPRTHMFLTVQLEEPVMIASSEARVAPSEASVVMIDPGFGGLAPRVPVPMRGKIAADGMTHELVHDGAYVTMRVDDSIHAWVSTFERDNPVDFDMANHFTATWPQSPFVNRLMARAYVPGGKVTVMNDQVTIAGEMRKVDRAELRAVIATHFGFDLPDIERLRVPTIPEWT